MYASFFGLNEKPFSITPDPRYLYLGPRHAEALAHLLYGITESGGFIQLTGEVGTGKTTVVRSLLEQLPEQTDVALVLNPRLSPEEFLLTICDELQVDVPERASPKSIIDALNARLLEAHAAGRRVVLIVDEAQNLSTDVLEQIRLLTNLETAKQKLLQIILIGQPELREVLARNELRQLAQRITGRYHLEPLEPDELAAYVKHRLEIAGSRAEIFTPGALRVIHKKSGGIPRLINVIADRALLGAWSHEERTVSADMARKAAREVFGERIKTQARRAPGVTALVLGVAGLAIAILAGVVSSMLHRHLGAPAPAAVVAPEAPAPVQRPPRVEPAEPEVEVPREPEIPAAAEVEPPPDPARPALAALLAEGRVPTGTDSAFAALFGRWGIEYRPEAGPACEQATEAGLRCLLQRGTWGEITVLNRPVILVLNDDAGREHQLVLSRLVGNDAEVLAGDTVLTVPIGELLPLWFGEYLLLWRPEAGDGRTLTVNSRGADVLWLRRALGELRGEPVPPVDSEVYEPGLQAAVRQFQRDARLAVDGLAGAMTLVSVNNALGLGNRPQLREVN